MISGTKYLTRILVILGIIFLFTGLFFAYLMLYENSSIAVRSKEIIYYVPLKLGVDLSEKDNPNLLTEKTNQEETVSGRVLFKMKVPKLGREYSIREGTGKAVLVRGPGHIRGTSYPWEARGNVGISGHRVTYGAPFRNLHLLEENDEIIVKYRENTMSYRVVWKRRVKPTDTWVIAPTELQSLTLTTCDPPFSAKYRLVIRAVRIE